MRDSTTLHIGVQVKCGGCGRTEMTLAEIRGEAAWWMLTGYGPEAPEQKRLEIRTPVSDNGHVGSDPILVVERPPGWKDVKSFGGRIDWRCGQEGCT